MPLETAPVRLEQNPPALHLWTAVLLVEGRLDGVAVDHSIRLRKCGRQLTLMQQWLQKKRRTQISKTVAMACVIKRE